MKTRRTRREAQRPTTEISMRAKLDAERLEEYRLHRSSVGEAMVRAVLRAIAALEVTTTVNEIIESRYGLEGVVINAADVSAIVSNVLALEITSVLVGCSKLSPADRRELTARVLARTVPRRDNVPQSIASRRPVEPPRVEDVERVIARELRRSGIRPSSKIEGEH